MSDISLMRRKEHGCYAAGLLTMFLAFLVG